MSARLALAVTPDGRRIVSGDADGSVRLWDVETGGEVGELKGHVGPVHAVAVTSDGRYVVSGGNDGRVRVWDLHSGRQHRTIEVHWALRIPLRVRALAVTPDGQQIVGVSDWGLLHVWGVEEWKAGPCIHRWPAIRFDCVYGRRHARRAADPLRQRGRDS